MTPHRLHVDGFNRRATSARRETVEMLDGRVYYSDDNWKTVYLIPVEGEPRRITGRAADLARFLAVAQSSASASPQQGTAK